MAKSSGWLKGIVAAVIAVLISFAFYVWWNTHQTTRASVTKGLVAYWSFDGSSVTGIRVKDVSGNGNDGSATSNPEFVMGKIGEAFRLNGANYFVDAGSRAP